MLLLDSNAFLWMQFAPDRLKVSARVALEAHEGALAISIASIWEIEIKRASGKLDYGKFNWFAAQESGWLTIVSIRLDDALRASGLPFVNRDPFDRMIAAQALNRNARVVTRDDVFTAYGVDVVAG